MRIIPNVYFQAINRLGGQQMKQECDDLKVKILNQTNQEIILNIRRSNDEIINLKKSVESLKKANEDMSIEVNKLKLSHKDTVPWNIKGKYLTSRIVIQKKLLILRNKSKFNYCLNFDYMLCKKQSR